MPWQEELRKLDEELASGKLSADDYRTRRDQVLSSAVGPAGASQPPAAPPPAPASEHSSRDAQNDDAESTQKVRPVTPPASPPHTSPDTTQVVEDHDSSADRTQAVSGWHAQAPQFASHQTATPPPSPSSPPSGTPHPSAWEIREPPAAPPWGASDFPPLSPGSNQDWLNQGPESDGKGGAGKIIGIAVAVVLLAGIAFGGWWLWGRDSSTPATGGPQTSQQREPTTTTTQQNENLPLAEVAGTLENKPAVTTFSDVPRLDYLTGAELSVYQDAGAEAVNFTSTWLPEGGKAILFLTEVADGDAGANAVQELADIQIDNGAKQAQQQPEGIRVTEFESGDGLGQIRGHYVSGNVIVRIEVANQEGLSAARESFDQLLAAQLDLLPADA